MKTAAVFVPAVLLTAAFCFSAFAEEPAGGMKGEEAMKSGMMHRKGMMAEHGKMKGMCPMHEEMCSMMMKKEVVAVGDGGVVVLAGDKIYKYDKYLNLEKEAEIKIDLESMQKKMMKMKENCPMCGRQAAIPEAAAVE